MVDTVKVEDEPRFATAAFGSVWVSNYLGSSVSRVDPASGKVTATIDVDLGGQVMPRWTVRSGSPRSTTTR